MSHLGHSMNESSNGRNGGFTERHRETRLEYELPDATETIALAVDTALTALSGSPSTTYFMSASLFAHGPGFGSGIKFQPYEDPLEDVIPSTAPI